MKIRFAYGSKLVCKKDKPLEDCQEFFERVDAIKSAWNGVRDIYVKIHLKITSIGGKRGGDRERKRERAERRENAKSLTEMKLSGRQTKDVYRKSKLTSEVI